MSGSKLNSLLLPLLVAILLSIGTKLRISSTIDTVFFALLYPIHQPIGLMRGIFDRQTTYIKSLPNIQKQNQDLKQLNSKILSENELLKQTLTESKTTSVPNDFKLVLPVRVTGVLGNNTVASSLPLDRVQKGMVLVSGKILIGFVDDVKGSVILITSLNNEHVNVLSIHTSTEQKGQFKYQNNTPQITDIPRLSPLQLNDYVFTEPYGLIPGNLIIGKITKVISSSQEPLQKAEVSLETTLSDSPENLVIVLDP